MKGIESEDNTVCCDSRCAECGGVGCDDVAGLSGEDCCTDDIEMKDERCSEKRSAPCVMDDEPGGFLGFRFKVSIDQMYFMAD